MDSGPEVNYYYVISALFFFVSLQGHYGAIHTCGWLYRDHKRGPEGVQSVCQMVEANRQNKVIHRNVYQSLRITPIDLRNAKGTKGYAQDTLITSLNLVKT